MESFAVLMFLVPFLNIRGIISTEGGKVFNITRDCASPFDANGHGRQVAYESLMLTLSAYFILAHALRKI